MSDVQARLFAGTALIVAGVCIATFGSAPWIGFGTVAFGFVVAQFQWRF